MSRQRRTFQVETPHKSSTVVRITNLLFALTAVSFFAYLLIYYSLGQAGNGGEYWGYDGFQEPRFVVVDAIRADDFRFLAVHLDDPYETSASATPGIADCSNHPLGPWPQARHGASEPVHGADSLRLASTFAYAFNVDMGRFLNNEFGANCRLLLRR